MSSELGVPLPPDPDHDEFLQSLRRASDSSAPQLASDLQTSHLSNMHQGDAVQNPASAHAAAVGASKTLVGSQVTMQVPAAPFATVTIGENAPAGTVVATLGALGLDAGETFTYALASDPSGKFEVVGTQVLVNAGASLDFEAATSHDISVTITDANGRSRTEVIRIAITDPNGSSTATGGSAQVNRAPSDLTVAGGTVQENAGAGTVVATLGALDPDAGDSFSYALASDPSGKFEVVGNEVRVKAGASLDHEAAASHDITVTVTDAGGLSRSEVISIAVSNQSGNIVGTAGNDVLNGTAEEDTISGLAGNDTLNGGAGIDTLIGGLGNDTYVIDATGDVVTEAAGEGTDTVQSSITYTLGTNVENLTLMGSGAINATGNTLNNTLTGNAGDNVLDGGAGNDTMLGGAGNDTYVVDSTSDVVTEAASQGTDTVRSSITYTLGANLENLTLTGSGAINATGNTLDNVLTGNAGNNTLSGGAGNDTLIGGRGNDTMLGGAGDDEFIYGKGDGTDTVNGGSGSWVDTISIDQSAGSLQFGTDWTIALTSGSIVAQTPGEILLSNDADGTINFADGSKVNFTDFERVEW